MVGCIGWPWFRLVIWLGDLTFRALFMIDVWYVGWVFVVGLLGLFVCFEFLVLRFLYGFFS